MSLSLAGVRLDYPGQPACDCGGLALGGLTVNGHPDLPAYVEVEDFGWIHILVAMRSGSGRAR